MAPSNRIRCFVEMAIMMLAVAAPSFGQISAHGYISDCDENKVLSDYANDNMGSRWTRYLLGDSDLKSTQQSSLARYCIDGAVNQARELLEHPFEWPANQ